MKKAVVVFSGGQDSTTCLIQALTQFDQVHCITFDYQQRHRAEIDAAANIVRLLNHSYENKIASHKILDVSLLNELAISSLTRDNIAVSSQLQANGLPNSFVPGRNILFLTLAGIFAYQIDASTVITGVCETDFSGYPDCRNDFIKTMEHALAIGMDRPLTLATPLMWLTKAQTWELADNLGKLDFVKDNTLTCYNGVIGQGCQSCPACELRQNGLDLYLTTKSG